MIYLQLFILLGLLCMMLMLEIGTLASPSLICLAVYLISTFFAAIYFEKWNYEYSVDAFLVILMLLIAFCFVELIVDYIYQKRVRDGVGYRTSYIANDHKFEVGNAKIVVLLIYITISTAIYYRAVDSLSKQYGNILGGLWRIIYYSRQAQVHGNLSIPNYVTLMASFCKYIAYTFGYVIIHNKILYNEKIKFRYLLPIVAWIPISVLSGARTSYIYFFGFLIVSYLTIYQIHKGVSSSFIMRFVRRFIPIFLVFLILFNLIGRLKLSGVTQNPLDHIAKYVGFSIPAFSYFLKNGWGRNSYFGEYTLSRVYGITNRIGLTNIEIKSKFLPFITLPGGENSNIYSAPARYIQDFGIIGAIVAIILISLFYSILKNKVYCDGASNFRIMIYAAFVWPLFLISIEDTFFVEFVSTTPIYMLIMFWILKVFLFNEGRKFRIGAFSRRRRT